MATDRELVQTAYEDVVQTLFTTFFSSFNSAMADPAAVTEAEQRFKAGILRARQVRDRALALLP